MKFKKKSKYIVALTLLITLVLTGCASLLGLTSSSSQLESNQPEEEQVSPDKEESEEIEYSERESVIGILDETAKPWAEMIASTPDGISMSLTNVEAEEVYTLLTTMEAERVPTPYQYESQQSDYSIRLTIKFGDGMTQEVYNTESLSAFYRYLDTVGDSNDRGYVYGISEELYIILTDAIGRADESRESEYDDTTSNNIHFDIATDELLEKYNSFHEYIINEDGERIMIWTDTEKKILSFLLLIMMIRETKFIML